MTVPLHSSNAAVATLSTSSLTFTPMNWNVPQAVTVAGAVNPSATATASYTVVTDPAVSPTCLTEGATPPTCRSRTNR